MGHKNKHRINELSLEDWKIIVNKLRKIGCQQIAISGGEPLLYPGIFNFIEYCKKKNLRVILTTNGSYITVKVAKELMSSGVDYVQISMDGLKREHEFLRGKGSYQKAVGAIRNLSEAGVRYGVMCIISKVNHKTIEVFVRRLISYGVVNIGFERLTPVGNGCQMINYVLKKDELQRAFYGIYALRKRYKQASININDPLKILLDDQVRDLTAGEKCPCGGCLAGIATCVVSAKGDLKLCTRLPHTLGNLLIHDLKYIWNNSELILKLRQRGLRGECGNCKFIYSCGGCRAEAFAFTGDILGEDPGCWAQVRAVARMKPKRSPTLSRH